MSNRQFLHEQLYRGEELQQLLHNSNVVVAGCGAIGSWVANILARMGILRFRLIDKDKVEVWNVATQSFTPRNLGQTKVHAVRQQIYRISRDSRTEVHAVELTGRNAKNLLDNADLIICTFDNKASRLVVKSATLQHKIPCVFSGMNGAEYYFEVIWAENYRPPDDPPILDVDPCNYPLSATLVFLAATTTAEIATRFLLHNKRDSARVNYAMLTGVDK